MAISFVGTASGVTSAILPAHQAGDIILAFAVSEEYEQIYTTWWVAGSNNETSGTIPGSSRVFFAIYRGIETALWDPVRIGIVTNTGTGTAISYPSYIQGRPGVPNSTTFVTVGMHVNTDGALETPPSGFTYRGGNNTTTEFACHDMMAVSGSFAGDTVEVGGTSGKWWAVTIGLPEVIASDKKGTWDTLGLYGALSNGDRTVTHNDDFSYDLGVLTTDGHSEGKKYVEIDFNGGPPDAYIDLNYQVTDPFSYQQFVIAFGGGGSYGNTVNDNFNNLTGTVRIAVDFDNELVWLAVNGGDWNADETADPETGTGGFSYTNKNGYDGSEIRLAYYGYASFDVGAGHSATLRPNINSFTYTRPEGFEPWSEVDEDASMWFMF